MTAEVEVALALNKLVHDECRNVPYDIGLRIGKIVTEYGKSQWNEAIDAAVNTLEGWENMDYYCHELEYLKKEMRPAEEWADKLISNQIGIIKEIQKEAWNEAIEAAMANCEFEDAVDCNIISLGQLNKLKKK